MYTQAQPDSSSPIVTFMQQMIPHHLNAVNMAKALLKLVPHDEIEAVEDLEPTLLNIINVQNFQIHFFRNYLHPLGKLEHTPYCECDDFRNGQDETPGAVTCAKVNTNKDILMCYPPNHPGSCQFNAGSTRCLVEPDDYDGELYAPCYDKQAKKYCKKTVKKGKCAKAKKAKKCKSSCAQCD